MSTILSRRLGIIKMKKIKQLDRLNIRIDENRKLQYEQLAISRQMKLSALIKFLLDRELSNK